MRAAQASRREVASRRAADLAPIAEWGAPGVAAVYGAMPDEIDPAPLADRLLAAGWALVLPVVQDKGVPLVFRRAGGPLIPDAAGLPAPGSDAAALRPDLVIAPLLAFGDDGRRLGQGGGYYDRTLSSLRSEGPVLVVGLAFDVQYHPDWPVEAHDQRLDAILTESGYRRF